MRIRVVRSFGDLLLLLWAGVLAIVVISLVVAAFRLQVSQSRVVGNYSAEHDNGNEQLELRADGTYVQHYRKGTASVETKGSWEFRRQPFARPLVLLNEFTPHFPRHDGPTRLWSLEVEEDFGMIRLYVDPTPPRDIYVGAPDPSYYD